LHNQNENEILQSGIYSIQTDSTNMALIGAQIQANLKVPISGIYNNVQLFFPRKDISIHNLNPLEDFNIQNIDVVGVLTYQPEFDNLVLAPIGDRKSTRLNSSHVKISYAVFCLKKKKK